MSSSVPVIDLLTVRTRFRAAGSLNAVTTNVFAWAFSEEEPLVMEMMRKTDRIQKAIGLKMSARIAMLVPEVVA